MNGCSDETNWPLLKMKRLSLRKYTLFSECGVICCSKMFPWSLCKTRDWRKSLHVILLSQMKLSYKWAVWVCFCVCVCMLSIWDSGTLKCIGDHLHFKYHNFTPFFVFFLCYFTFMYLVFPLSFCLFSHPHTRWQTERFLCLFLNGKNNKKRHRHHCGSRALDSIFNLVRAVSKMPSHSFFTWTQQCENCEILHFSCKHMWVCLPAKVWLCLVGVCNVCKEKGDHGDFHCIIYVNITNGPENLKAIQWAHSDAHMWLLQPITYCMCIALISISATLCKNLFICVDCYTSQ